MIHVFFIDDHDIVRKGLISLIKECPEFKFAGQAGDGIEALKLISEMENKPDIVLTDIEMPKMDGIELTKALRKTYNSQIKIVALTMIKQNTYIKKMLQAGAMGYVLKNSHLDELSQAITMAHNNETYFSEEVSHEIMNHLSKFNKSETLSKNVTLTEREREVLQMIVKDMSNQEIANELFISVRTVETHKQNLISKTGAKGVAGLVVLAIQNKFVEI
ncbi:MAG: response regulator transcription factor [Crocinitomicaceae bacterium]